MAILDKQFCDLENLRFLITLIGTELSKYYNKNQVDESIRNAIKSISSMDFKKTDALPEIGEKGHIYIVPNSGSESQNVFNEYFWDEEGQKFELFGTTKMDLTGYLKRDEISILNNQELLDMWNAVFGGTNDGQ